MWNAIANDGRVGMTYKNKRQYRVYTVRMWRESAADDWHFAIQRSRQPASTHGLASPDALAEYMRTEMRVDSAENAPNT